jgi:chromosome segregation ATPase
MEWYEYVMIGINIGVLILVGFKLRNDIRWGKAEKNALQGQIGELEKQVETLKLTHVEQYNKNMEELKKALDRVEELRQKAEEEKAKVEERLKQAEKDAEEAVNKMEKERQKLAEDLESNITGLEQIIDDRDDTIRRLQEDLAKCMGEEVTTTTTTTTTEEATEASINDIRVIQTRLAGMEVPNPFQGMQELQVRINTIMEPYIQMQEQIQKMTEEIMRPIVNFQAHNISLSTHLLSSFPYTPDINKAPEEDAEDK